MTKRLLELERAVEGKKACRTTNLNKKVVGREVRSQLRQSADLLILRRSTLEKTDDIKDPFNLFAVLHM